MQLDVKRSNSWCVVEDKRVTPAEACAEIYRGEGVSSDFSIFQTDIPSLEQTRFKAYRDGNELLVVIGPGCRIDKLTDGDSLEIFFDPYHDHIGYFQFYFDTCGNMLETSHLPYADVHSTTFPRITLSDSKWEFEPSQNVVGVDETTPWLFARFALDGIFRNGSCCGFNITRFSHIMNESDAWNHFGGCGFQDATAFGHLYCGEIPVTVSIVHADIQGHHLHLSGGASIAEGSFYLEIFDPFGEPAMVTVAVQDGAWQATVELGQLVHGRYRLHPKSADGRSLEPESFYFDYAMPETAPRHDLCMTYDIPDNLRNNTYTPERLAAQIDQLIDCGITKLYWIDYPTFDEYPALWIWASHEEYCRESYAHGDLLTLAAEQCRQKGVEFWGIFKPFDLGFTGTYPASPASRLQAEQLGIVQDIDGRYQIAFPEIVRHQQWTMQTDPAWVREAAYPVTTLRFYSEEPLESLTAEDIVLWVSDDYESFAPYDGPMTVSCGRQDRPHYRWTPSGKQREPGTAEHWYVELSGLQLRSPLLLMEVKKDAALVNRTFMMIEAVDGAGDDVPLTLGSGSRERGLNFDAPWNWNNYTEEIVERRRRRLHGTAIVFAQRARQSTLFDPCYPEARHVWVQQTERILKSEAVGVDIRTLCHHNTCHSWLMYAFAPAVRALFRERYRRDATLTDDDYVRVRKIRGECYTEYLRDVRRSADRHGKKVAAHLEPGIEVPIEMHIRMQMEIEWKKWIAEGLIDEITLKYWTPQNRFIQEEVLPLARKAGIPVYQGERNFNTNCARAVEWAEWAAVNTYRAGLAGFNFYEVESYFILNPQGESWPVGNADSAIRRASQLVQRMREERVGT